MSQNIATDRAASVSPGRINPRRLQLPCDHKSDPMCRTRLRCPQTRVSLPRRSLMRSLQRVRR
jgi:hypothetical protein